MGKLDGQVALITGGTKGIGEAAVRLFVQEGARVVLCGRTREGGERIAAETKRRWRAAGSLFCAGCDRL